MTDPAETENPRASVPAPEDETRLVKRVLVKDALFAAIDEAEGYKATQLAEAAGVTDATLSFMRHQGRDVRISTFQRLLDAMPAHVYLRFYQHLGEGLAQDALTDSETSPAKIISALFQLCDDESLMALVKELAALSKERHKKGSKLLSALALLMELMQYCELDDIPELISYVGKYTSTAISKVTEKIPEEQG